MRFKVLCSRPGLLGCFGTSVSAGFFPSKLEESTFNGPTLFDSEWSIGIRGEDADDEATHWDSLPASLNFH